MKRKRKTSCRVRRKTVNAPQLGFEDSNPEPMSVTDYIYEHIERTQTGDKVPGVTPPISPAQRELTLLLTVPSIEREIEMLRSEALKGSIAATEALHRIAATSTADLAFVVNQAPDLARRIAEYESTWPVPYSEAGRHKKYAAKLIANLNLGNKLTSPLDPGNVLSEDTVARKLLYTITRGMERIRIEVINQKEKAERLSPVKEQMDSLGFRIPPETLQQCDYEDLHAAAITQYEIESLRALLKVEQPLKNPETLGKFIQGSARLPELTPEAVEAWMAVIKQFLMDVCEGHPEISALRTLGTFQAASSPASYESNLRTGIWVRLRTTLARIAKVGGQPGDRA